MRTERVVSLGGGSESSGYERWFGGTGSRRVVLLVLAASGFLLANGLATLRAGDSERGLSRPAAVTSASVDTTIAALQDRAQRRPGDARVLGWLGAAYLQKARETGDPTYYPRAEAALNQSLAIAPENLDALIARGELALARHQFAEALTWAERARLLTPHRAAIYGIIGDAQIELGNYPAAFAAFQEMMDRRPDAAAYARASYARELTGDAAGAIAALEQAAAMGAPAGEAAAWLRVQLGHLYFTYRGDRDAAAAAYQQALNAFPGYLHARAGLARIAATRGDYATAIAEYREVTNRVPLPEYVIALGEVYELAGRPADAARQFDLVRVIERLYQANGVDTNLDLALFDADHRHNLEANRDRLRALYAARPSIKVADALAWTLFQLGDYPAAETALAAALRLATRDPLLLYHAGRIRAARGDAAAARADLEQALALNPHFSFRYAADARRRLTELTRDAPGAGNGGSPAADRFSHSD